MTNEEIVKKLVEEKRANRQALVREETNDIAKYLVFRKGNTRYAFFARHIKEIIMQSDFFYVPYVPDYVKGLINRHGEPYMVIDVQTLFHNESEDSNKFLIMNIEDDQIAFMISDILEIKSVENADIHTLQSLENENKFFSGSFTDSNNEEIFIINLLKIREKLENDIN